MLEAVNLSKSFYYGLFQRNKNDAVKNVSFKIKKGETLCLLGESGCGKTTAGMMIAGLIKPTSGMVLYRKENIFKYRPKELKKFRTRLQIIFQDPDTVLNPRWIIEKSLSEPLRIHGLANGKESRDRIMELIETVGLSHEHLNRYPFELSGGQLQRIILARALLLKPDFIVADEPTSSLDVSVQAQILTIFKELQKKFQLSCLFITHDLHVARCIADRIAVMYKGTMLEEGNAEDIFSNPVHPYTRGLLDSLIIPDPEAVHPLDSNIPITSDRNYTGCKYKELCDYREQICEEKEPVLKK
ncbi:MAG: ATP-binding cassette domain-containing protein [Dethiobacter sp.]|jgi:peptide/nickel transport system ATP-binding protein/oligopeptide transport system ATP-binding protein|nr:MAG: ATP-binding cassette domain-containing protein [Dethiobacter sp.]